MTFKPNGQDLAQLEGLGLTVERVQAQIDNFREGFPKSRLDAKRICTGLAVLLPLLLFCGVNAAAKRAQNPHVSKKARTLSIFASETMFGTK